MSQIPSAHAATAPEQTGVVSGNASRNISRNIPNHHVPLTIPLPNLVFTETDFSIHVFPYSYWLSLFLQAPMTIPLHGVVAQADGTIQLQISPIAAPTFVVPLENAFVNEGAR